MKKSTPSLKLKIHRETLRVLEKPQLEMAAGAEESATVRFSNCGSCNTGPEIFTA